MSRVFLFAMLLAVLLVLATASSSSSSAASAASAGSSSSTGMTGTSVSTVSTAPTASTAATASSAATGTSVSSTGAAPTLTFCQKYSGTSTNATIQEALLTAIVVRAVTGGTYTAPTTPPMNYTVLGLFNATGPLYALFTGQYQYRFGAPNYVTNGSQLAILATKLVGYFGALFGCTATGYTPVAYADMYAVHANMSINSVQETYFDTALATTLLSFGVTSADVNTTAAPALGLFNKCGAPIAGISSTARVQICGTSDCPIATDSSYATCETYYSYPSSSSAGTVVGTISSSSSSTNTSSSDAAGKYTTSSVVFVVVAAVVASLVL